MKHKHIRRSLAIFLALAMIATFTFGSAFASFAEEPADADIPAGTEEGAPADDPADPVDDPADSEDPADDPADPADPADDEADADTEDPAIEEPVIEEPDIEEPVIEEPATPEPAPVSEEEDIDALESGDEEVVEAAAATDIEWKVTLKGATDGDYAYLLVYDKASKSYSAYDDQWNTISSSSIDDKRVATFTFDAKYKGKKALISYSHYNYPIGYDKNNDPIYSQNLADYKYASQIIGGHLGSTSEVEEVDLKDYPKEYTIITLPKANAAASYSLKAFSFLKVNVTPKQVTTGKTRTWTSASVYQDTALKDGTPAQRYSSEVYQLTNAEKGVYYFYAVPGAFYLAAASGSTAKYKNATDGDGDYIKNSNKSYPMTWLGGYEGSWVYGSPAKLTTVKAPAAGIVLNAGTIKLKLPPEKYKGSVKGKTLGSYVYLQAVDGSISYSVANDDYQKYIDSNYSINYDSSKVHKFTAKNIKPGVYRVYDSTYYYGSTTKYLAVAKKAITQNLTTKKINYVDISSYVTHVSGTRTAGSTLTATTAAAAANIDYKVYPKYSYIWTDGTKILSKSASYTLSATVAKGNLYIITTASAVKYSTSSQQLVIGDGSAVANFTASISGKVKSGGTLTAKAENAVAKGFSYTYQWYAGGKAIAGAKSKTYKVSKANSAKEITVQITAKKADWIAKTAKATAGGDLDFTLKVSGKYNVGQKLTATASKTVTPKQKFTYQWLSDGNPIDKATKSTYTVAQADFGKKISVEVTSTKDGWKSKVIKSTQTIVK
ncbi:MAG: hypothetical protein LBN12_09340 [Clostridiales Family XIII bacterium]|nr:hypothetical protein [Clostridiales Family XIII bacterium]